MSRGKVYILSYEAKPNIRNVLFYPVKWIIKLFTGSRINHVAYAYKYRGCGTLINEAVGSGFRSINYKRGLLDRDCNVYAHEVIVDINLSSLHKDTFDSRGKEYKVSHAAYSAIDRVPFLGSLWKKIFKLEIDGDEIPFCSEATLILCFKRQNYLSSIMDSSKSPEELIKTLYRNSLIRGRVHVWDGKKIINNIFE